MKQLKHAELKTYTSKEIKKYSRVPEKRYTQIAGEHGSHIISFLLLEGFSAIFFSDVSSECHKWASIAAYE